MPGLGPYPVPSTWRREPTLDDKIAAVRAKFPYVSLPPDFGTHPADMEFLDRVSSPMPEWMQKAGDKVADFFGAGQPKKNELISRVASMKGVGGQSLSDVKTNSIMRAGRLLVDHVLPAEGAVGKVTDLVQKANALYNKEIPVVQMSARTAMSTKSALSDIAEISGYHHNQYGGYYSLAGARPDPEYVASIYQEASARGLDPQIVAREHQDYLEMMMTPRGEEWSRQQEGLNQPLWQNDDGSITRVRDLEEGPNAAAKVMRYVPKFLEKNDEA